ncbi:MAG: hypothetical protein WC654_06350 [Patescibacteria group bacterium]
MRTLHIAPLVSRFTNEKEILAGRRSVTPTRGAVAHAAEGTCRCQICTRRERSAARLGLLQDVMLTQGHHEENQDEEQGEY